MKFSKHILLLSGALLISVPMVYSQRRPAPKPVTPKLEDLPQRPIDTIDTVDPETKVIIFSNNTWEFYRPTLNRMDDLPVYTNHWDTSSVFSYRDIELTDIPMVVELKLIDSMSQFTPPLRGSVFSKYGPRRRRNHNGVDIPLKTGEPIMAAFDGKIRYAKYNSGGFGNLVIVRHVNGLETWHAHLSKLNVTVGDYVKSGQVIGFGGNTGRSRGPHLHFEVRYKDQTFDPEFLFDFQAGTIRYQTFALERSFFNIHSRASELLEEDDDDFNMDNTLLANADDSTTIRAAEPKPKPAPAATSSSGAVYHTIKSGDMLGKLSIRYGVSIAQICRLNNINEKTTLALGRKLRIK